MRYLLDTNVLSEGVKRRPNPGVVSWLVQHEEAASISALTLGELTKGAYFVADGPKRRRLLTWITEVEESFDDRVLPLSREVLIAWGQLCGAHEAKGRCWPVLDSLLAATAMVHDLIIVTRNTEDFPPEVMTLVPWKN